MEGEPGGRVLNGCGPYRVTATSEGVIEFAATHAAFGSTGGPENIRVHRDARALNPAAQQDLVAAGELDYASFLDGSHFVGAAVAGSGMRVEQSPLLHVYMLGIRCDLKPLDQPLVRRALAYALDRQAIVDRARNGEGVPAQGLLPPGVLGHDRSARGVTYDPERARRLLREAGFPDGADLHVVRPRPTNGRVQSLDVAIEMARAAGFRIEIEEAPTAISEMPAGWRQRSHLFSTGWIGDYPDPDAFFFPLFHSSGSEIHGYAYSSPLLDALITEARGAQDRDKRVALYRRAERILQEDMPCIFLWHQKACIVYNPKVLSPPPFSVIPPFFHPEYALPPLEEPAPVHRDA